MSNSRNVDAEAELAIKAKLNSNKRDNVEEERKYLEHLARQNGVDPSIPLVAKPSVPVQKNVDSSSKLVLKAGKAYKKLLIRSEPRGVYVEVESADIKFAGVINSVEFE